MKPARDREAGLEAPARKPRSLVVKLLALVVSLTLVAELGSAGLISHFVARAARDGFDERLAAFIEARNEIVGTLVWRLQHEELDRILREMLTEPSIVSVEIFDESDTLVGSATRLGEAEGTTIERSSELRYVSQNVRARTGRISVRASLEPILAQRRSQMLHAVLVALVSAAAVILAIWIAVRLLIARPLAILNHTIELTRNGHEGVRAPDRPLDEIGTFYQAFNGFIESQEQAVRDIRQANDRLIELAVRDDLTGLPNRRAAQAVFAARRGATETAVLFIDLDKFKTINDTLGHRAGDTLLRLFSERLTRAMREGGSAYRLGGDEFLVLQGGIASPKEALAFAEGIRAATAGEYVLGTTVHPLDLSLGIYLAEEGLDDFDDIISLADLALADAKRSGRGRVAMLNREIRHNLAEKIWLEREIKIALSRGGFEAQFQPQIEHATGRILSAESLSRWRHPVRGMMPPSKFMPLIEEMGLSLEHGRIMIAHCCAAVSILRQQVDAEFRVSLNVNARQIGNPEFWAALTADLARHQLPPSAIEIEITESELIENFDVTNPALANYRALGGTIALDDFGTGYSSLGYLARLPFDTIKIDRSFVHDAVENRTAAAVIRLIVAFAAETGTKVIAEGIETALEEERTLACGVRSLQGFRYGRPMPLPELLAHIRRQPDATRIEVARMHLRAVKRATA